MPIGAGKRDRKVSFYSVSASEDALGVEVEGRALVQAAWAAVTFGTGSERREAAQAGSQQAAVFRVLSTSALRGVTERDEIDFGGVNWGIVSIAPVGPQGREIEFTAVKNGA